MGLEKVYASMITLATTYHIHYSQRNTRPSQIEICCGLKERKKKKRKRRENIIESNDVMFRWMESFPQELIYLLRFISRKYRNDKKNEISPKYDVPMFDALQLNRLGCDTLLFVVCESLIISTSQS